MVCRGSAPDKASALEKAASLRSFDRQAARTPNDARYLPLEVEQFQ
jgi:hypothetical protein